MRSFVPLVDPRMQARWKGRPGRGGGESACAMPTKIDKYAPTKGEEDEEEEAGEFDFAENALDLSFCLLASRRDFGAGLGWGKRPEN